MGQWEPNEGGSDEWYTPPYIFEALGCRFDLDVAHPKDRATFVPADARICENGLAAEWHGFVWCNPPFGGRNGIVPWLDKFFQHGNGIALATDRTSAPWFRAAWDKSDLVLFMPKVKFFKPDGTRGASPANGTALFAAGDQGAEALLRAARQGLGALAIPFPVASEKAA